MKPGYVVKALASTAALQEHRTTIEAGFTVRTIRIPDRHTVIRFRGRCPYCSGTLFDPYVPPVNLENTSLICHGEISCVDCSRVVVKLEIGQPWQLTDEGRASLSAQPKRGRRPKLISSGERL